ncbi:hypothetical protein [uncultured Zoogloea sp.]|uniref:hypothetical protein n=1 Tax=uncultured Zoogloea sp. TaxID=160237 RepID=UPI00260E0E6A|nr:hypothetical protein [uncultured Zoogloea sp.]
MISAHTTPADLVARILQPLARSLEEARQHLALEDVDDTPADEESPPAPDTAPVLRLTPHGSASHLQPPPSSGLPTTPAARIDRSGPQATPALRPRAPVTPASAAAVTPGAAPSVQPSFSTAGNPSSASVAPPAADTARHTAPSTPATSSPTATVPTPGPFPTGAAPQPASPPAAPGDPAPPAPSPAAIRLVRADALADQPPAPSVAEDASPPTTPAAFKTSPPSGTPPLPAAHPDAPTRTIAQPAHTPSAPTPRHWRLRPAASIEAPPPFADDTLGADAAEAPAPARPATAPSLLPRNPALTRVMQAMDPVLDKAWQLTDASRPAGRDAPSDMAAEAPRVTNQFNVTVALGEATDTAGRDPRQLEDALVALLRDAARRQGLDV